MPTFLKLSVLFGVSSRFSFLWFTLRTEGRICRSVTGLVFNHASATNDTSRSSGTFDGSCRQVGFRPRGWPVGFSPALLLLLSQAPSFINRSCLVLCCTESGPTAALQCNWRFEECLCFIDNKLKWFWDKIAKSNYELLYYCHRVSTQLQLTNLLKYQISVCHHGKTQLSLNRFSWNSIWVFFENLSTGEIWFH